MSVVDAGGLTIAISDNGQGFDKEQIINKGLGLLGMRARVEALRGRFELKSSPHKGTTVVAHFNNPHHPLGGQHD